jgi:hypothetical protein
MDAHNVGTRAKVNLTRASTLFTVALLGHAQLPYAASGTGNTNLPSTKDMTLNVTALDAIGHPATDLTCADFRIFDEGKPQHIAPCNVTAEQPPRTLIFWLCAGNCKGLSFHWVRACTFLSGCPGMPKPVSWASVFPD